MLKKALRLFHTVKYLKRRQLIWRAINLLPRFVKKTEKHPPILDVLNKNLFIYRKNFTTDFQNFTFLNETYDINIVGWNNLLISKLWRYNLHYFEFLLQDNETNEQKELKYKLIENWIDNNQFSKGTGWEPYPTSLRIINWIKWHWSTRRLSDRAMISLWNQVRWLESRPEFHLLGNHLFINAKALLYATVFFEQKSNSKIYNTALKIIKKELDEQFLPDGAHFELSPMYHSLAMEDLLDLTSISDILPSSFPKVKILEKYKKGMQWLKTMVYDNEELSHFNDCANGIAPTFTQLQEYASNLGVINQPLEIDKFTHHRESGFFVFKDKNFHLIADVGKVGPDYLPGHAHADTLSFELAIKGNRVVVNSGTSVYGTSIERLRQRGTSAHSTIQIDGEDSSEVWSGFRVARRATPFNLEIKSEEDNNNFCFSASHDGYKRLKNSPIHKRNFIFKNDVWQIHDEIRREGNYIISRYFLHPDIEVEQYDLYLILSKNGKKIVRISFDLLSQVEICESTFHDEFGKIKNNKCLKVKKVSPCNLIAKFEIL